MWQKLLDFIFPLRTDEDIVREMSLEQFLSHLEPQLEERTNPATITLLPFADRKVRATIHEAKYHGSPRAFRFLAAALVEYLRDDDRFDGLRDAVLIPLPLGAKRRQERGFNQAEEVARLAAKELKLPLVTDLLTRTRETVSQVSLPRAARGKNMRGAFGAARPADPSLTYILIDDVTTTGATLSAAIATIKAAGACDITPIALAH
jgi:ComF family protein